MKCFLWAMNYVPLWNDFCGQRIRSHGICWLPVLAFIFSHLQFEVSAELFPLSGGALSSVMPLSMFPCFGWMRIYALLTVHAAFVLSCCAPTSRFGKQGSRFSFCVIHTCMFRDGCWIPSPSQIRGVCAAFVPHVQLRWVVADGMLQKFVESVTQSATTHSCKPKVKPGLTCLPHGWVTIMC